jgi:predicted dehydrogenase
MESYPASVDQAYVEQLHYFFNCVEKGDSPTIGIREGLKVLKVIDAARISSRDGIRVAIN